MADPFICHGSPTFKGTRKLVRDAIEAFTLGVTSDDLSQEAEVPREAIIEAVQLAAVAVNEYYSAPDPDMNELEMDVAAELTATGKEET